MSRRPGSLLGPGEGFPAWVGRSLSALAVVLVLLAGLVATDVLAVGTPDHARVADAAAASPTEVTAAVPTPAAGTPAASTQPESTPPESTQPSATPTGAAPATPRAGAAPQGALVAGPQPLPAATSAAPVSVEVPAIGVDSTIERIDRDAASSELVPPDTTDTVGWFQGGPVPGDAGPAVIAGHVDSVAGPAVFFGLRELLPGDAVTVVRADGVRETFRVSRVAQYAKGAFPTQSVYGPTPGAELRLITCGGTFDPGVRSYRDNVVVYAQRV